MELIINFKDTKWFYRDKSAVGCDTWKGVVIPVYSDTSANEDNSFRNHIR